MDLKTLQNNLNHNEMDITNNIQDKNFLFLKKYCELFPQEANKFVVLKETANGTRYIEYIFIKGRPHDFTCLSWYDKPHPNYAKEHNGWQPPVIRHKVNCIYNLESFTCDGKCEVGCPPIECSYIDSGRRAGKKWRDWSYKYPVKCACWQLCELDEQDLNDMKKKYYSIFKRIMDASQLTPEILTAEGWECNVSRKHPYKQQFRKEGERFNEFCCDVMFVIFEDGKVSVYYYDDTTDHKADFRRNGEIIVGEFNQLLDIVGLTKFKI